jgi:5-hydroxyisourate hydrolase
VSNLSTHVLDAVTGLPAPGMGVTLCTSGGVEIASGTTDSDGRIQAIGDDDLAQGTYRLTFDTGTWFGDQDIEHFYPEVSIAFAVTDTSRHHHVPLLLSPFAYSTYRGS